MKRIDHIGIAVRDLNEAEKVFTDVLGVGPFKKESVDDESVQVSFFQAGESKVELLESTTKMVPLRATLKREAKDCIMLPFMWMIWIRS